MPAGHLKAERVGPHVKFTVHLPEGHDHVLIERHGGIDPMTGKEVWTPIHTGHAMYTRAGGDGTVEAWDRSTSTEPGLTDAELPELPPGTYRALAYQRYYRVGTQVRLLRSTDAYTAPVTI